MPKRLMKGQTHDTRIQMLRYLFVGFAAFGVDFATLYLMTEVMGLHYLVSNIFGFVFGLACNYLLSIRWVFAHRKHQSRRKEFVLFTLVGLAGLLINQAVMWGMTDVAGVYYLYSKIVATGIVFFWNFFVRKFVVFY